MQVPGFTSGYDLVWSTNTKVPISSLNNAMKSIPASEYHRLTSPYTQMTVSASSKLTWSQRTQDGIAVGSATMWGVSVTSARGVTVSATEVIVDEGAGWGVLAGVEVSN